MVRAALLQEAHGRGDLLARLGVLHGDRVDVVRVAIRVQGRHVARVGALRGRWERRRSRKSVRTKVKAR